MIKTLMKNLFSKANEEANVAEQNAKNYADSLASDMIEIHQTQISLPSAVSASAGGRVQLLNNVDIRTLSYSALDDIRGMTKTLVGVVFLWTNGASGISVDTLVSDGKASVTCYFPSASTVSAIRLLTFWK